jgi:acetyl esterase/lipase
MNGGPFDPDAAAILERMAAAGSRSLSELGVAGVRDLMENMPRPPGPQMESVEDVQLAGPHGPLLVRLYRPSSDRVSPAIVFFHGGGMVMGSVDSYDHLARQLAASCSAVVASVDYRLAPEHKYPTATDEAYFATQWIFEHAGEVGCDARRVAVGGDSAGGCLAAAVCLMARDRGGPSIVAQLLVYPGVDRDYELPSIHEFADGPILTLPDIVWMKDAYLGTGDSPDHPYAVPANCADLSDLPEAIVVTAANDPIRDGCEKYGLRLRDAGVQTALLRYPGVYHGFFSQGHLLRRAQMAMGEVAALMRTKFDLARMDDHVPNPNGSGGRRPKS